MDDPSFFLMAWRLQGASEMIAYHLIIYGDEKEQELGHKLLAITSWFTTGEPVRYTHPHSREEREEV